MASKKPSDAKQPTTPAAETVNRHTRSFTPVAGYDTVALVGVQVHGSIKVTDKAATDLQDAILAEAKRLVAKMIPAATNVSVKQSSAWARLTGDTAASVKQPKSNGHVSASRTVARIFEDNADEAKLRDLARTKLAADPTGDRKAALVAAAKELKLSDDTLRKMGLAAVLGIAAPKPANPPAKK